MERLQHAAIQEEKNEQLVPVAYIEKRRSEIMQEAIRYSMGVGSIEQIYPDMNSLEREEIKRSCGVCFVLSPGKGQ